MKTYAIARLNEIDALPDGRYHYRPVRHHFGITSFGVTAWVGATAGDPIINEYDEESEPAEELFVVVSGDHDPRLRRHAGQGVRRDRLGVVGTTQAALRQRRARRAKSAARRRHRRQSPVSDACLQPGLQREPERPLGRGDRSPAERGRRVREAPRRCTRGLRLRRYPRRAVVQGADRRVTGRTPAPRRSSLGLGLQWPHGTGNNPGSRSRVRHVPDEAVGQGPSRSLADSPARMQTWIDAGGVDRGASLIGNRSVGANVGATRPNGLPPPGGRVRTTGVAIIPGHELIRTALNAMRVSTGQKAGVRVLAGAPGPGVPAAD